MGTTEELFGVQPETEVVNPPATEPEKKEPEATQTEKVTEEQKEPEVSQEQAGELQPYKDDEFLALDFLQMDKERLTPAQMKIYRKAKDVDSEATRRFEEAANLRKQVESDLRQKEMPKTKTIADYFDDDPDGTLVWIDQQILSKKQVATQNKQMAMQYRQQADYDSAFTYNDAALTAMSEASDWETVKSTLSTKLLLKTVKENSEEKKIRKALESFPNYESKKEMAIKFILKENPEFTEEEARDIIDANKGKSNIKLAKLLSSIAEKSVISPNIDSKIVKTAPDALGRPGSSQPSAKKEEFDYAKEFELAKETGKWNKVLKYKGAI